MASTSILIVESDLTWREQIGQAITALGHKILSVSDYAHALEAGTGWPVDLIISEVTFLSNPLIQLEKYRQQFGASVSVIFAADDGNVEKAVQAMRAGATDYLSKPVTLEKLLNRVQQCLGLDRQNNFPVAEDPTSRELLHLATRVARSDVSILLTGESGTGKEVMARHIHLTSTRAQGPFVAVNCAAIPENMLEAVLFGYEKGAFTGAYRTYAGKFEQAQHGTLLLDEITEMDQSLQAKLLRVLQEREVDHIGGHTPIALDVRVLATTNRNLREAVVEGRFREDLYYRLNVFPLHLKPLRARLGDVLPLARRLLTQLTQAGDRIPELSSSAQRALLSYPWPGNVRELGNVLQRAMILREGEKIDTDDLIFNLPEGDLPEQMDDSVSHALGTGLRLREQNLILDALRLGNGSRKQTAEVLGISPRTLRYKLARLRNAGIAIPA